MKSCKNCGKELEGRKDKIYCSTYCRSAFQYKENKNKEGTMYQRIDEQLKLNRRILKLYNRSGKATVRKSVLLEEGFNPKYFTNYWKNTKGDVYLFVYEFGFLNRKENGNEKYVLIKWQDYMG